MDISPTESDFKINFQNKILDINGHTYDTSILITSNGDIQPLENTITPSDLAHTAKKKGYNLALWAENQINSNKRAMITYMFWNFNIGAEINSIEATCSTLPILLSEKRPFICFIIV